MKTKVKTQSEILAMRESGQMLASVLSVLENSIGAGMTTKDLAEIAKAELRKLGGQPTFLGYQGFREVLCVSVNDEIVHGIPGTRILKPGDIVSVDFGVTYKGMITDAARSVIIGEGSANDRMLLWTTKESLDAGIMAAHARCHVGDISSAVQTVLDSKKLGIIRELVGHGVGHQLHEEPNIPNYGRAGSGMILEAGMTIAIEPMATLGNHNVYLKNDNWTVCTSDGSQSAHFEDTILITDGSAEILTRL